MGWLQRWGCCGRALDLRLAFSVLLWVAADSSTRVDGLDSFHHHSSREKRAPSSNHHQQQESARGDIGTPGHLGILITHPRRVRPRCTLSSSTTPAPSTPRSRSPGRLTSTSSALRSTASQRSKLTVKAPKSTTPEDTTPSELPTRTTSFVDPLPRLPGRPSETASESKPTNTAAGTIAAMITDDQLNRLAIFLGSLMMLLIVLYHFLAVNSGEREGNEDAKKTTTTAAGTTMVEKAGAGEN